MRAKVQKKKNIYKRTRMRVPRKQQNGSKKMLRGQDKALVMFLLARGGRTWQIAPPPPQVT